MDLSFFTTLKPGWLNTWILSLGALLVQFVWMALFREGGRRAVDTSWYTAKDKINASVSTSLQILLILLSIFVPFKWGTAWFTVGIIVFSVSLLASIYAYHSYAAGEPGKTIRGGLYRRSRNPMYFFFFLSMFGLCIASASLWMLLVMVPFAISTHLTVLGEERYCAETYGEEYLRYKANTPRYFLFF
ncbi:MULTISPECIES: isoprenylcysteine carboxylmethyltransferase family protein [Porphyromonas]|uniref:Membrane protein n=1 Tax=Porphyromonas canoris TaxID=36875 RepID=A0ABR4XK45_9PORP|nr:MULTISPECIES: methyltransferase [Porphyromonas]KGL52364.1 membrane protein [Porphyromonas canoris]KGN70510.1 membrane protein [Porphyromonas sp. COT-108 OH1349]KGN92028.1 membrane protein [Porphyromonas canoris]KGN96117.1 membrane protein [Porphyromonas sp. COT-108 OH2963]